MNDATFSAGSHHRAGLRRWLVLGLLAGLLLAALVPSAIADPAGRSGRNRISQINSGLFQLDNGRHKATLDATGVHFTPRVTGELRPDAALSLFST